MTKLWIRSALLVGGVALAGVTAHTIFKDDSAAATRPVTGQVMQARQRAFRAPTQPGYHIGRTLDGAPEDNHGHGKTLLDVTTPGRQHGDRTAPPQSNVARGFGWFGLARSTQEDGETTRRTSPDGVRVVDPTATTTQQAPATAAPECKGLDLQIQAQGVTADVSFVGILLKGTELEGAQFSGAELGDLRIVVQWKNLFSNHQQRLNLVAPDGSVYQMLSRPLTATDVAVATVVPVSGTWITRYGLYGGWCVDVFFDQDEKPVASRRVVISG